VRSFVNIDGRADDRLINRRDSRESKPYAVP